MRTNHQQLRQELRQAGANASEADELTHIAASLGSLKATNEHKRWSMLLKPAVLASSALAVGLIIVMLAQSVTPTSWLYPVQKLSDAVAVKAHPGYRAAVMMRRAQQVNELVASHASSQVILSTLNSYSSEAAGYKASPNTNYAVFDYCKTNLEQAAAAAPYNVRQAIINSLDSLKIS